VISKSPRRIAQHTHTHTARTHTQTHTDTHAHTRTHTHAHAHTHTHARTRTRTHTHTHTCIHTHTYTHTPRARTHTHTRTNTHTHTHTHTHTTYRRTRESFEVTRILSELGIGSIPDILRPFLFLPRVERAWILRGRVQVASSGGEQWRGVKVMVGGEGYDRCCSDCAGERMREGTRAVQQHTLCTTEPIHSHRDRCSSAHKQADAHALRTCV
jgi:hypothetical protein